MMRRPQSARFLGKKFDTSSVNVQGQLLASSLASAVATIELLGAPESTTTSFLSFCVMRLPSFLHTMKQRYSSPTNRLSALLLNWLRFMYTEQAFVTFIPNCGLLLNFASRFLLEGRPSQLSNTPFVSRRLFQFAGSNRLHTYRLENSAMKSSMSMQKAPSSWAQNPTIDFSRVVHTESWSAHLPFHSTPIDPCGLRRQTRLLLSTVFIPSTSQACRCTMPPGDTAESPSGLSGEPAPMAHLFLTNYWSLAQRIGILSAYSFSTISVGQPPVISLIAMCILPLAMLAYPLLSLAQAFSRMAGHSTFSPFSDLPNSSSPSLEQGSRSSTMTQTSLPYLQNLTRYPPGGLLHSLVPIPKFSFTDPNTTPIELIKQQSPRLPCFTSMALPSWPLNSWPPSIRFVVCSRGFTSSGIIRSLKSLSSQSLPPSCSTRFFSFQGPSGISAKGRSFMFLLRSRSSSSCSLFNSSASLRLRSSSSFWRISSCWLLRLACFFTHSAQMISNLTLCSTFIILSLACAREYPRSTSVTLRMLKIIFRFISQGSATSMKLRKSCIISRCLLEIAIYDRSHQSTITRYSRSSASCSNSYSCGRVPSLEFSICLRSSVQRTSSPYTSPLCSRIISTVCAQLRVSKSFVRYCYFLPLSYMFLVVKQTNASTATTSAIRVTATPTWEGTTNEATIPPQTTSRPSPRRKRKGTSIRRRSWFLSSSMMNTGMNVGAKKTCQFYPQQISTPPAPSTSVSATMRYATEKPKIESEVVEMKEATIMPMKVARTSTADTMTTGRGIYLVLALIVSTNSTQQMKNTPTMIATPGMTPMPQTESPPPPKSRTAEMARAAIDSLSKVWALSSKQLQPSARKESPGKKDRLKMRQQTEEYLVNPEEMKYMIAQPTESSRLSAREITSASPYLWWRYILQRGARNSTSCVRVTEMFQPQSALALGIVGSGFVKNTSTPKPAAISRNSTSETTMLQSVRGKLPLKKAAANPPSLRQSSTNYSRSMASFCFSSRKSCTSLCCWVSLRISAQRSMRLALALRSFSILAFRVSMTTGTSQSFSLQLEKATASRKIIMGMKRQASQTKANFDSEQKKAPMRMMMACSTTSEILRLSQKLRQKNRVTIECTFRSLRRQIRKHTMAVEMLNVTSRLPIMTAQKASFCPPSSTTLLGMREGPSPAMMPVTTTAITTRRKSVNSGLRVMLTQRLLPKLGISSSQGRWCSAARQKLQLPRMMKMRQKPVYQSDGPNIERQARMVNTMATQTKGEVEETYCQVISRIIRSRTTVTTDITVPTWRKEVVANMEAEQAASRPRDTRQIPATARPLYRVRTFERYPIRPPMQRREGLLISSSERAFWTIAPRWFSMASEMVQYLNLQTSTQKDTSAPLRKRKSPDCAYQVQMKLEQPMFLSRQSVVNWNTVRKATMSANLRQVNLPAVGRKIARRNNPAKRIGTAGYRPKLTAVTMKQTSSRMAGTSSSSPTSTSPGISRKSRSLKNYSRSIQLRRARRLNLKRARTVTERASVERKEAAMPTQKDVTSLLAVDIQYQEHKARPAPS